jgi:2-polyprenyl-3-methyl-5-hydroxy-6-metoxy-1,4-benzoquinol methylase
LHAKGLNIEEDTEYDFFPNYMRPKGVTLRKRIDIETTINFLKRVYKLENSKKIFFEYKNIYNLIKENYDFVFCFGVLYHLKNPYLAIENLYKITNDTLVLETQGSFSNSNDYSGILDMDDGFVRHSPEALKFLLKKAGFRKVEILFNGVSKIKKISNIVLKATKNV